MAGNQTDATNIDPITIILRNRQKYSIDAHQRAIGDFEMASVEGYFDV